MGCVRCAGVMSALRAAWRRYEAFASTWDSGCSLLGAGVVRANASWSAVSLAAEAAERATRRIGSTHPATTWRTVPGVAGDVRIRSRKRGCDRRIASEGAIGAIASANRGRHPFLRGCRPAPFSTLRPWQAAAADAPPRRFVLTLRGTSCRFPPLLRDNHCVAAESAGIGLCTTSRRRIGPPSYPAGTRRKHFLPRALSTGCSVRSRMACLCVPALAAVVPRSIAFGRRIRRLGPAAMSCARSPRAARPSAGGG